MGAEATRRFFDAIAPRYDRVFAREREDMRAHMARLLDVLGPSRDVLDLGIGTGTELHHLLDAGHRVVGVDISPAMLARCNQRSRKVECIEADVWTGLPVSDGTFDAVIALFGTLAHPPTEDALDRLAQDVVRVLRPRGLFYAEVPTVTWAAANPRFVDHVTGTAIHIHATSRWREAFSAFDVALDEREPELTVIARRRA
jgi:SAM-dependent methyltransferase